MDTTPIRSIMFYCDHCLRTQNVGKYFTKTGDCVMCGKKDTSGNTVTAEDIANSDQLGKDAAGLDWRWTLPAFNSAESYNSVCPRCGHNVFDRHTISSDKLYKYSCNDCGNPLVLPNNKYAYVKTVDQLKAWIKHHRVLVNPGTTYISNEYGEIQLITDHKTMFFVDKSYKVAGYMVNRQATKSRADLGVSQPIIDRMLSSLGNNECQWPYR